MARVEVDHPEHRIGALVRMATQIARQLAAQPGGSVEAVIAGTAAHLETFWEPTMRTDLAGAVGAGIVTVDDVVAQAIGRLTPST